ncbi:malto-oligosyltrehalose synthase [Siccirubricoccus sp. KC 17139]|uniref:Malto-oligosyltrehalose synthase n=1 Tax=Siccirubricoccus soli TaxID=2899147 RepID=A0ABT1CZF7_9PROT|nr:malto-oligosyltrehalose synthase [Siccirubricoccus soli]MCO6415048.1 malto-oligosyltrehalose synthase [Siccirubricoccus soli]MCP2681179.1 malto-oligosyltrehalose synthase [Siccirubricoccus soli]
MAEIPVPRATYRLQFHAGFRFRDAAALAPYLARLGISHVYASPWLKARPGSSHGYDIVDHAALNPELGDEAEFHAMCEAFRQHGLGQILDFVPNHMGVGGADNPWWLDVLEWGSDSAYAGWFDIDWDPDRRYLAGKLLIPFLGDQYGVVLEAGQLRLRFDAEEGSFAVWAYDTHKLPICPHHYARVLGDAHPVLERLGDAFAGLSDWRPQIAARARELKAELAAAAREDATVQEAVQQAVDRLNGREGELESWRALDALIQDQHWRVAHFRVAADDINYRRFFNINELAGIRMELPELFDHAHARVFALLADGTLDGLRIDHVDGLLDPKGYLARLRERAPRPFYLVVEKILARHEALREDWPVEGTTGYEFANLVLGLLVDSTGEEGLTRAYADFVGEVPPFEEVVRDCKLRIMANEMASELNVLARDAGRIARQNPKTADFTRNILGRALRAIVAAFPVYRTYVDASGTPGEADRRDLDWAVAWARRFEPDLDPSVFDFLQRLLSTDLVAAPRSGFSRHTVMRFAMRVQQYSGPVMAKGLEDTAFYRWNRLVALNEVGGHPDVLGLPLAAFHKANAARAKRWPHAMLSTSTHDTKRGEDTRARLAVLAEMPEEWSRQIRSWSRILRARRGDVEGTAPPDRNDEYLFYQLLLGAWPAEMTDAPLDADALSAFAERLEGAMRKSVREAKLHSSWAAPDMAYEDALLGFVRDALAPGASSAFLDAFLPFQSQVARLGLENSLVQAALKLSVPGMPDIYQGAELWDLSLVDPDNRRPVDFAARQRLLAEMEEALAQDRPGALRGMRESWSDGRLKLALTATLLAHRRTQPALYAEGDYQPLTAEGDMAERICAFLRCRGGEALLVAARRFPARGEAAGGIRLALPLAVTQWRDLWSGAGLRAEDGVLDLSGLLAEWPVAALVPEAAAP